MSVGSVARREKRTGRDYLGRWMQDANNDEGRRTNDVRLFVHSSHSVDRMFPSALNSFGIQNRGWVVTLRGSRRPFVIIRHVIIYHTDVWDRHELFLSIIDCTIYRMTMHFIFYL